jgi:exonuclease 1
VFTCAVELAKGYSTQKHLDFCVKKLEMILNNNIRVYLVFDGGKLPSKKGEEK